MCTIALLVDVVPGAQLVVAANRDELYARPARGPERLRSEHPAIAGGVDVLSGGTWLAVRADGQFAAVTNQRALVTPPVGLRSRGHAVRELAAAIDPEHYVASLDVTQYASMNLVWRGPNGVAIAYARREEATLEIERLGRGVHVLCNDRLGTPGYPRGPRLQATIEGALAAGIVLQPTDGRLGILDIMQLALADHTRESLADTPPSHLPIELARELTATCIHSPEYGTRSSTFLALGPGVIRYLHADGPPCTTGFLDYTRLLA
jgi:uncharacterized protein with NRDE domain